MTETASPRELRRFGLLLGSLFLVFGDGIPFLKHQVFPLWPAALAIVLGSLSFVYPAALYQVQKFWSAAGHILGLVNSRIVLFLIYYFILVPLAMLLRLFRPDTMARRFEFEKKTYRIDRAARMNKTQLERMF